MFRNILKLYVDNILEFSSQYGSEIGSAYKINKLIGDHSIFPHYGDFSDAAVFRTYGKSWKNCPSALKEIRSIAIADYSSEDYVEFSIKYPVIVENFEIYETYNPGSVERIYFFLNKTWQIMWQKNSSEDRQVLKESRIFSPNIKTQTVPCSKFRVEVNQAHCEYYAEFDAIRVSGSASSSPPPPDHVIPSDEPLSLRALSINTPPNGQDHISLLPEEILIRIFSFFPLRTLSTIASVSRRFQASVTQALCDLTEVNFKRTWAQLDHASLVWVGARCPNLARVDLSWCGKSPHFTLFGLCHFLSLAGPHLASLRLSSCTAVNDVVMRALVKNCPSLQELDLSSCVNLTCASFADLRHLPLLRHLNLYRTAVNSEAIEAAADSWVLLAHLNLGSCTNIDRWSTVVKKLSACCRGLRSVDLWRSDISSEEVSEMVRACPLLEEIDLGWCLKLYSEAGCIATIARCAPRLKKLFLTSNRSITDADITILAEMCPLLEQLDVLGARRLTPESVETLLRRCPRLRMLDLSFCGGIDRRQILHWSTLFPHCSILVSYQDRLCSKS